MAYTSMYDALIGVVSIVLLRFITLVLPLAKVKSSSVDFLLVIL